MPHLVRVPAMEVLSEIVINHWNLAVPYTTVNNWRDIIFLAPNFGLLAQKFGMFLDFQYKKTFLFLSRFVVSGVKIFIDSKAQLSLLETEMDYTESKLSSEFVFNNPNIKGTCGCGESFHL